MVKVLLLIFCIYFDSNNVRSAKILGNFLVPSISHQLVYQPIWRELSLRGHEVTVSTPNPLNDCQLTNLTEIDLGFTHKIVEKCSMQSALHKQLPFRQVLIGIQDALDQFVQAELAYPPMQALIRNNSKTFDIMLVEYFHPTMSSLSAIFNCSVIGVTSMDAFVTGHDTMANPSHPVLNPSLFFQIPTGNGIFGRIASTYFDTLNRFLYHYTLLPQQDLVKAQYISSSIPYLGNIEKNLSMLFVNVNPILHPIRPNVPAVIELGRMHIRPGKKLPTDLQMELDAAKEGFIYFSLGSNVKSSNLSIELREIIIAALSELPYKVLWKWEDDYLPGKPKNVLIRKWFPQQDILGHPNIKVFLTQGGLQSVEEAISYGVPLVGMPFFVDQPMNVMKMVKLGCALGVDTETLTKEQLRDVLMEVATNPQYRESIRKIREIFADVPMTGLEKAIWWTEYVIRHKGARHLRSAALDIPWYQYFLLDVLTFVFAVNVIAIFLMLKIVSLIIKILRNNKSVQHKQKVS